jgi:hypothetical protein
MGRCETDVSCRVIVGGDVPTFRTISDFRKIHLSALEGLFVEVLKLCRSAGLAKVGRVALDGTKVKANASRHKAMSYDRMKQEEKRLKKEIKELLAQAQAADEQEDAQHGQDRRGDGLPDELARREDRLKKIREAKRALEEQAKAAAREEAESRAAAGKAPKETLPEKEKPAPKSQRNFTDPESKIMKSSNKGWDQCGNAQAVANEDQIILSADVTDQANDKQQLEPMLEQTRENLKRAKCRKQRPGEFLADAGYYSEANVELLESQQVDPYLATGHLKHHEEIKTPRGRPPANLTTKQKMARKLRTKRGRKVYGNGRGSSNRSSGRSNTPAASANSSFEG